MECLSRLQQVESSVCRSSFDVSQTFREQAIPKAHQFSNARIIFWFGDEVALSDPSALYEGSECMHPC